jgi:PKD repeat protein
MQRDAVTKMDLISVGSPAVPQFAVNISSGPAPLIVLFSDFSSGIPTQWHWEFGDGITSDAQNPVHVYAVPGVYDVTLTVRNTFGNASCAKQNSITVMDGTFSSCEIPSEGVTLIGAGDATLLKINMTYDPNSSYILQDDNSVWVYFPDQRYGLKQLEFYSNDTNGFSVEGNDTISGILEGMQLTSEDIAPRNFSQKVGNNCVFNFTLSPPDYPADGVIDVVAWEGCTPEDNQSFDTIKSLSIPSYSAIHDVAYSVKFGQANRYETGPATLVFAVSADWVKEYGWSDDRDLEIDTNTTGAMVFIDGTYVGVSPVVVTNVSEGPHQVRATLSGYKDNISTLEIDRDQRNSIHVIRIGDDGSGEVLDTTFIGHDPERNLDFFRAESPNGLSTFGLASLSGSGNLFKLLYLAIAQAAKPQYGGANGPGGGGGGGTFSEVRTPTTVPTLTPSPTLTPLPTISQGPTGTSSPPPSPPSYPGTPFPTEVPPVTPTDDGGTPLPALVILKNLAVVFGVIFVTLVLYLRWNKREP